ncbi:DUF998 domain-containing protein [Sulfitobacter sp. HNIBRBA3233]|uniref:DUF998 domain-containing protein n=1 Tax=Sulfitobacter marinivivus TaxID=3158558 RepID=UPI0032E04C91
MDTSQFTRPPGSAFVTSLGVCAILGSLALLVGNVVGSIVVPGHDWVADTVSDLAAGRYEIIQDVTLYAYSGALAALALAAAHLHRAHWQWSAFVGLLTVLALCVTVIGARNEYGDGDTDGVVVHIYIVYALGAAYIACFALAGRIFADINRPLSRLSWVCCALWAVGVPVFFMLPTAYDGAFERGLGLVSIVWTVATGAWLVRLGRAL